MKRSPCFVREFLLGNFFYARTLSGSSPNADKNITSANIITY